jgi:hypothetical protein
MDLRDYLKLERIKDPEAGVYHLEIWKVNENGIIEY